MTSGDDLKCTAQPGLSLRGVSALGSTDFAATQTPEGRRWIAGLESLVEALAVEWRLSRKSDASWHGYNAVVMLVERDEEPLALKVVWPPERVSLEVRALKAWHGRGAVGLIASDERRGALLLQRLDPARSLASVPLTEAAIVAGELIRARAIASPEGIPSMEAVERGIA